MASRQIGFDALLVTGAGWVLLASAAWTVLLLLAGALERLSAGRCRSLRWVGCPVSWRPAVLLTVSALLALPAAPATAGTGWLPSPERTSDTPSPGVGATVPVPTVPAPARGDHLVVRAGDSLWSLARTRLPRADDAEIHALVGRLHEANRAVIGDDPDLIHPGQRLRLPTDTPGAPR